MALLDENARFVMKAVSLGSTARSVEFSEGVDVSWAESLVHTPFALPVLD
jgi:hypothetical protein